jgi:hypothetical protein
MRSEILTYLQGADLGTIKVSSEFPYSNSGLELYYKNPKYVYVGEENKEIKTIVATMDGLNIDEQVDSLFVYLATDAKSIPSDYDKALEAIRNARYLPISLDYINTQSIVKTQYNNDLMLTEVEFVFSKIIS